MSTVAEPAVWSATASQQYGGQVVTYFPVPFHFQNHLLVPDPLGLLTSSSQSQQRQHFSNPYVTAPPVVYPSAYPATAPVLVPPTVYCLPATQLQQGTMPKYSNSVKAALANSEIEQKVETKKQAIPHKAAGQTWEDPTLADWPEMNDDVLSRAFSRFPSFNMARVVRDKRTGKTRGYGFVSFANHSDLVAALKEMNGKYVGNRPIKLRKSKWKDRIDYEALEKQKSPSPKKAKQ